MRAPEEASGPAAERFCVLRLRSPQAPSERSPLKARGCRPVRRRRPVGHSERRAPRSSRPNTRILASRPREVPSQAACRLGEPPRLSCEATVAARFKEGEISARALPNPCASSLPPPQSAVFPRLLVAWGSQF